MKADCGVNYTFNRIIPKFLSAAAFTDQLEVLEGTVFWTT